jgi:16S rRNA (uracil1498-N3)-methyltransferase
MRRFFIDPDTEINDEILLSRRETHHIKKVLRLGPGTRLQLLDGQGNTHDAEIIALGKNAQLKIHASTHVEGDKTPLRVCQSVLKGQKMELLIQKCTELGVTLFTPYYSERSQIKKADLGKIAKKQERWQRIIEEACKQCNNPIMMRLAPLVSYEEMLQTEASDVQKLLFWEEEPQKNSLHSSPPRADGKGLQIVFGPEGGFPKEEVDLARDTGFQILSLGPRILKAETANIAAVSIIQHLLGNM